MAQDSGTAVSVTHIAQDTWQDQISGSKEQEARGLHTQLKHTDFKQVHQMVREWPWVEVPKIKNTQYTSPPHIKPLI